MLHRKQLIKLLGITVDSKLSFEKHVSGPGCKTAASLLSALKRLCLHIAYEKTLVQSSVLSHFNYCPFVWYFTTTKQLQKIEKIQEEAVRFIADGYETSCEMLMINTETTTMTAKQMQTVCVEIYKTLSNLKREYMQDLFERNPSSYCTRRLNDLKLCSHLPENMKSSDNLYIFKQLVKDRNGPSCGCNYSTAFMLGIAK